jgi:hypothetical protein
MKPKNFEFPSTRKAIHCKEILAHFAGTKGEHHQLDRVFVE